MLTSPLTDVLLIANEKQTQSFNPNDGVLKIRMPDNAAPGNVKGYAEFEWDGTADTGTKINSGVYYIKTEVMDSYGHTESLIKQVTLLKLKNFIKAKIYNTAGELVREIELQTSKPSNYTLSVNDVLPIGKGEKNLILASFDGQEIIWDGTNGKGELVSGGIYEIQIISNTAEGLNKIASKTVTIINYEDEKAVGDIKAYPNPCDTSAGCGGFTFEWTGAAKELKIKVYSLNGELVASADAVPLSNSVFVPSNKLSSGLYIYVAEGTGINGKREHKKGKITLINMKIQQDDEKLN